MATQDKLCLWMALMPFGKKTPHHTKKPKKKTIYPNFNILKHWVSFAHILWLRLKNPFDTI